MITGELHWKTKQDEKNPKKTTKLHNDMAKAMFKPMSNEKS